MFGEKSPARRPSALVSPVQACSARAVVECRSFRPKWTSEQSSPWQQGFGKTVGGRGRAEGDLLLAARRSCASRQGLTRGEELRPPGNQADGSGGPGRPGALAGPPRGACSGCWPARGQPGRLRQARPIRRWPARSRRPRPGNGHGRQARRMAPCGPTPASTALRGILAKVRGPGSLRHGAPPGPVAQAGGGFERGAGEESLWATCARGQDYLAWVARPWPGSLLP